MARDTTIPTYKDDSHDGEGHDGLPLVNSLVCSNESILCLLNASLLLLE